MEPSLIFCQKDMEICLPKCKFVVLGVVVVEFEFFEQLDMLVHFVHMIDVLEYLSFEIHKDLEYLCLVYYFYEDFIHMYCYPKDYNLVEDTLD